MIYRVGLRYPQGQRDKRMLRFYTVCEVQQCREAGVSADHTRRIENNDSSNNTTWHTSNHCADTNSATQQNSQPCALHDNVVATLIQRRAADELAKHSTLATKHNHRPPSRSQATATDNATAAVQSPEPLCERVAAALTFVLPTLPLLRLLRFL